MLSGGKKSASQRDFSVFDGRKEYPLGEIQRKIYVIMNKYTAMSASKIQKLVMCNPIHRKRAWWTTSVDNPVEKVDNLDEIRFHA